jgi:DNA sulfur modification protein DndB
MNKNRLIFPALRCRMGDWFYYVTYLKFSDVSQWIKKTEEVHNSKKLADWIQRRLDSNHTNAIRDYLLTQSERFFNSIVVGVYGGNPEWAPLKVTIPANIEFSDLSAEEETELESSIGLLRFSGYENLFAIDGQHRVAGIKKAIGQSEDLCQDEVCAIFVGHENTPKGTEQTRRLFTTLNKTAKKVANADIVALDEDDGFAVVTRCIVDGFSLFTSGNRIAFSASPAIPRNDKTSLTSIIGIYQVAQDLYPRKKVSMLPTKATVKKARPTDEIIQLIYQKNCQYWTFLKNHIQEINDVLDNDEATLERYRSSEQTHLLFRNVGQRAFTSAVEILISRGRSTEDAIQLLASQNLWLQDEEWHGILWNPYKGTIIARNRTVAETFLLKRVGEEGRTKKNEQRLNEVIASREAISA